MTLAPLSTCWNTMVNLIEGVLLRKRAFNGNMLPFTSSSRDSHRDSYLRFLYHFDDRNASSGRLSIGFARKSYRRKDIQTIREPSSMILQDLCDCIFNDDFLRTMVVTGEHYRS